MFCCFNAVLISQISQHMHFPGNPQWISKQSNIHLLKEEYGEYVCIFPRIWRWLNFINVRIHFAYFLFVHDIVHTYYSSKENYVRTIDMHQIYILFHNFTYSTFIFLIGRFLFWSQVGMTLYEAITICHNNFQTNILN